MKGLELCERYFRNEGQPVLEREFGSLFDRMAIGLVGDGSECYGYDDEISRDHDWGPSFCIWLTKGDYEAAGGRIREVYDRLPRTYEGYGQRMGSRWGEGRVGVLEIQAFYRGFIGPYQPPGNNGEWLVLPENALAAATNGKVFHDPLGEFTKIRAALLQFYPEDVRLKKIASRCMTAGREGQYNFPRCVKRGEFYAAQYGETKFCADAMSMVFLFNRRYAPFYKWTHRALKGLPVLGDSLYHGISNLVAERDYALKAERIERISQTLIGELRRQGLSDHPSDFLPDHGPIVQQSIQDQELRERNVWTG
jgi:hypothetical protein